MREAGLSEVFPYKWTLQLDMRTGLWCRMNVWRFVGEVSIGAVDLVQKVAQLHGT